MVNTAWRKIFFFLNKKHARQDAKKRVSSFKDPGSYEPDRHAAVITHNSHCLPLFVMWKVIPSQWRLVKFTLNCSCQAAFSAPTADWLKCFTGGRSHGRFHGASFLLSGITFLPNLEMNLNYSLPWIIFDWRSRCRGAARSGRPRMTGDRQACVRVRTYIVLNVFLLSWCPVQPDTFISDLPKAEPDGMWSSNALQAEENRVCFHRSDDAYLTCSWWWQH